MRSMIYLHYNQYLRYPRKLLNEIKNCRPNATNMQKVTKNLKISTSNFSARISSVSLVRYFYLSSLGSIDGHQIYDSFFDVNERRPVNIVLDS